MGARSDAHAGSLHAELLRFPAVSLLGADVAEAAAPVILLL